MGGQWTSQADNSSFPVDLLSVAAMRQLFCHNLPHTLHAVELDASVKSRYYSQYLITTNLGACTLYMPTV